MIFSGWTRFNGANRTRCNIHGVLREKKKKKKLKRKRYTRGKDIQTWKQTSLQFTRSDSMHWTIAVNTCTHFSHKLTHSSISAFASLDEFTCKRRNISSALCRDVWDTNVKVDKSYGSVFFFFFFFLVILVILLI